MDPCLTSSNFSIFFIMLILGFNNLHGHDVSSWHASFPSKSTEKYLESIVWACSFGIVSALQFESVQEPSELLVGHPLYLQVIDYLLLRQPKPSGFLHGNPVRLQLGRPVNVSVPLVP